MHTIRNELFTNQTLLYNVMLKLGVKNVILLSCIDSDSDILFDITHGNL